MRRCGSSGGVGDAAEFCAKDEVGNAKVKVAYSKILAILTEHPFANNYVKPSKRQVLSIRCAAIWRLYRGIPPAKHTDIRKSGNAANRTDCCPAMSETNILVNTRRRRPKTNGSFVFEDDPISVTPESCALCNPYARRERFHTDGLGLALCKAK